MEKYASSDKEFGINLARGKNVYKKLFFYYKGIKKPKSKSSGTMDRLKILLVLQRKEKENMKNKEVISKFHC